MTFARGRYGKTWTSSKSTSRLECTHEEYVQPMQHRVFGAINTHPNKTLHAILYITNEFDMRSRHAILEENSGYLREK